MQKSLEQSAMLRPVQTHNNAQDCATQKIACAGSFVTTRKACAAQQGNAAQNFQDLHGCVTHVRHAQDLGYGLKSFRDRLLFQRKITGCPN